MKRYGGTFLRAGIVMVIVALIGLAYLAYTSTQAQRKAVLTVNTRIEANTVITAEMLTTMELPAPGPQAVFPYFTDPAQIVNRTAVVALLPNVPISQDAVGEPAPPGRVLPSGQVIPPGYLGVAIPTAALRSVGGALKIGDTVTIQIPEPPDSTQPATPDEPTPYRILFTGVPVTDLRNAEGQSLVAGEAQGTAAFIVLALDPQQAEAVATYQDILKLAVEAK